MPTPSVPYVIPVEAHHLFLHLPFAFPLPTKWDAQKQFLENILALKGSRKRYESHIDGWFNDAGMIEKDRDVKLARQAATFYWLKINLDIFRIKKIKGAYFGGDEALETSVKAAMADTFDDCAYRCCDAIMDRERTFCDLALRFTPADMVLSDIRDAAILDRSYYMAAKGTSKKKAPDGSSKLNWTRINAAKTDERLIDLLYDWFGQDTRMNTTMASLSDTPTKIPTRVPSTLKDALDTIESTQVTAPTGPVPEFLVPGLRPLQPRIPRPVGFSEPWSSTPPPEVEANPKFKPAPAAPSIDDEDKFIPKKVHESKSVHPRDEFLFALDQLTAYYKEQLVANQLEMGPGCRAIQAGPVSLGRFLKDDIAGLRLGFGYIPYGSTPTGSLIPAENMTPAQLADFEKHLEAFDVAFRDYVEAHSKTKAWTKATDAILTFLKTKKEV